MNELRTLDESTVRDGRRRWIPKSISYAFGEPIVELAELDAWPGPFISDLDLRHTRSTRRLPLMDIPASELDACGAPVGFLFHLPRSGSTLVARMLTALPGVACVIEPEPINQLLSRAEPGALQAEWLRRLVLLYCGTAGAYPRAVIKLSSWAVLQAPLFAAAFPAARHGFVHRDPLEVLVQLLDRPSGWMAPHARTLILGDVANRSSITLEEYCARALGRFLQVAAAMPRLHALAYEDIPSRVPAAARALLTLAVDGAQAEDMQRVAQFDSEDWSLSLPYVHDGDTLQRKATPGARQLVERFAAAARQHVMTLGAGKKREGRR